MSLQRQPEIPILAVLLLQMILIYPGSVKSQSKSPSVLLNSEKMLMVDGKPRFVLGLYENPQNDTILKEAIDAGFFLFPCRADRTALDRLHQFGAKAWINVQKKFDFSSNPNAKKELKALADEFAVHPALLIWEGPDEILWNQWKPYYFVQTERKRLQPYIAGKQELEKLSEQTWDYYYRGLFDKFSKSLSDLDIRSGAPGTERKGDFRVNDIEKNLRKMMDGYAEGMRALKDLDPNHIIWMNHAPRNSLRDLLFINRNADMAGCDIYPVPSNLGVGHSDLPNKMLSTVGAYTERMQKAAPGKACAMVLQGFGWSDLLATTAEQRKVGMRRRPYYQESRFMAYDAIIHGANAIFYWGTEMLKSLDDQGMPVTGKPRIWNDLLHIAREIRAIEPALITKPVTGVEIYLEDSFGSFDNNGVLFTVRQVENDFLIIVINEIESEISEGRVFTLENLPRAINGRKLFRLYSDEEHVIKDKQFKDGIRQADVHVYATTRKFENIMVRDFIFSH